MASNRVTVFREKTHQRSALTASEQLSRRALSELATSTGYAALIAAYDLLLPMPPRFDATATTLIMMTAAARSLMRPVAVRSFLPSFPQSRRVRRCLAGPHGAFRPAADDMVCDEAHLVEIRHRVARDGEADLRAIIGLRGQHDVFGDVGIVKSAFGLAVAFECLGKIIGNAIPQMAGEGDDHVGVRMFGDALARCKDERKLRTRISILQEE